MLNELWIFLTFHFSHLLNQTLLGLNTVSCLLIFFRLFHFRRQGASHRPGVSLLALVMMLAAVSIPIMIFAGYIKQTSIPHTVLGITLLVAIWNSNGNLAQLSKPLMK
jgi:hypothetical protein